MLLFAMVSESFGVFEFAQADVARKYTLLVYSLVMLEHCILAKV